MADLDELWPPFRQQWVVFEDATLLVVDKPAGVPVHATELVGADLKSRLQRWLAARDGAEPRLWLLHGLDREASGLVVVSKDKAVNADLATQLKEGVARRFVMATAATPHAPAQAPQQRAGRERSGHARHQAAARGRRRTRLAPAQARPALAYETVAEQSSRRLLAVSAGHSGGGLRQQLAAAGAPIAGDRDAGGPAATRLLLHHQRMRLWHPRDQHWLALQSPLPRSFESWLAHGPEQRLADDAAALRGRLIEAIERRYPLALDSSCNAFRLVHGAGDDLPGVELDRYADHVVLRVHEDVPDTMRASLIEALAPLGFAGIYLKVRPRQASVVIDTRLPAWAPATPVHGSPAAEPLPVVENGIRYLSYLGEGLSTGLFLDQRDNRQRLRQLSGGKRILNLFCYHGAFTLAAIVGGAASTVSVDSSQTAISRAKQNFSQIGAEPPQHLLVCADALMWLEQALTQGQRFDVIVLDPPSYATTKTSRFSAKRDYIELARRCLRLLEPDGALLASTNLRAIDARLFERWLRAAAQQTSSSISRLEQLGCPLDHPPHPERGCHLKSVWLRLST